MSGNKSIKKSEEMDIEFERQKISDNVEILGYNSSNFSRLIASDLNVSQGARPTINNYTQEEVRELLDTYYLERSQQELSKISDLLYVRSSHYRRLIKYYADMPLFPHVVLPSKPLMDVDKDIVKKQYEKVSTTVLNMNLKHEMSKVLTETLKSGVFYGYIYRNKDSFTIQKINKDYCKITHEEDGSFVFSINMKEIEKESKSPIFEDLWAEEIVSKFRAWQAIKSKNSKIGDWVEIDAKNTICIKSDEEIMEVIPHFAGSFEDIFDIYGFKRLRKSKEELGNYMLITQKLPMRDNSDTVNDFLIDADMFGHFHKMATSAVPDNVGVITSPMEVNSVKFERDRADSDGVAKAERDFWSSSGVIFSSDKSTSEGFRASIKTDEQTIFKLVRQIERWINRYIKLHNRRLLFRVDILDVTTFNKTNVYKEYLEVGQYGIPVKTHISSIMGISPAQLESMAMIENDILGLTENLMPLKNSHTMSGDDVGRPSLEDGEKSDETVREEDKLS